MYRTGFRGGTFLCELGVSIRDGHFDLVAVSHFEERAEDLQGDEREPVAV